MQPGFILKKFQRNTKYSYSTYPVKESSIQLEEMRKELPVLNGEVWIGLQKDIKIRLILSGFYLHKESNHVKFEVADKGVIPLTLYNSNSINWHFSI